MKKILIIGSPGSGKSTLAKKMSKIMGYPILHLDRIYHIDNYSHISRDELLEQISRFVADKETFIIDGNYTATLEYRLNYADTVILFDIDTDTCLKNVIARILDNNPRDDIAPGFDNSIYHQDFIDYVKTFQDEKLPLIETILGEYTGRIIRLSSYFEVDNFLEEVFLS